MINRLLPLSLVAVMTAGLALPALAEANRVTFPENIDEVVHYSTVVRGEEERMLTSREAMEAAKQGLPMPDGSHVVIEFRQDGEVTRYFIMEKGAGWGADYGERTGDWQFQAFNADRTPDIANDSARCQSCHQARADSQYQFMYDDLLAFE
jgi:hypothetical protein